jgi:hypothetical protein
MAILNRIERFLYEAPAWKLIGALLALTFVKTGVWAIGNIDNAQLIARNPFVDPIVDPRAQYVMSNWLGPFLGWAIGATSPTAFFLMHLAFSAGFTALFIYLVFQKFSPEVARTSLLLFTILPVSATAYFWVGYDSITLFFMLLALAYPERIVVAAIAGWLLGMQHFEQALLGAGGLLFAAFLSRRQGETTTYSLNHCIAFLVGILLGKLTLTAIFFGFSIEIKVGRQQWMILHLGKIVSEFFLHFQYVIWSIFGVGWLAAVKYAEYSKYPSPFFRALLLLGCLLLVSQDQTRVITIITFPIVMAYWLYDEGFLRSVTRREASVAMLVWGLTPWSWVWAGEPKWSAFPYDLLYVIHAFGGGDVPAPVWTIPP